MDSIEYYDRKADSFVDRTINVDVSHIYEKFFVYLPAKSKILDAGCGSGRDAKFFQSLGHEVTAFDGSVEMVKRSSEIIGKETLHLRFEDINFNEEFDGIWASSSLIHVPYDMMKSVFTKLHSSLKPSGIFCCSFKYGNCQRDFDDRTFYDLDEETFLPYTKDLFDVIEMWQTPVIEGTPAPSMKWFMALCRKI